MKCAGRFQYYGDKVCFLSLVGISMFFTFAPKFIVGSVEGIFGSPTTMARDVRGDDCPVIASFLIGVVCYDIDPFPGAS